MVQVSAYCRFELQGAACTAVLCGVQLKQSIDTPPSTGYLGSYTAVLEAQDSSVGILLLSYEVCIN